jgi:AcrR family transcriptional regulator
MPRTGLGTDRVLQEGLRLLDEEGIAAVSLATLAARLGVKRPSLYNHVSSMEALREGLLALVLEDVAQAAEKALSRSSRAGFMEVTQALRSYVVRYPRRIDLLLLSAEGGGPELRHAAERLYSLVMNVLADYGLTGARAVHAVRTLRALWLGFSLIDTQGGYAMDVPVEESFRFAMEAMHKSFAAARRKLEPAP